MAFLGTMYDEDELLFLCTCLTLLILNNCSRDSAAWLVAYEDSELIFLPSRINLSKTSKLLGTEDS